MISLFLAMLGSTCQREIHFEVRKLNVHLKREVVTRDICLVDKPIEVAFQAMEQQEICKAEWKVAVRKKVIEIGSFACVSCCICSSMAVKEKESLKEER